MARDELLDDILDKFYESRVAKGMGHITGVERWALEAMAQFIIDSGWKSPEEFKEELNLKVDTFIMRVGGSHDKG
jgi:hypothetical protein